MIEIILVGIILFAAGVWGKDLNEAYRRAFFYAGLMTMAIGIFLLPAQYPNYPAPIWLGFVLVALTIIMALMDILGYIGKLLSHEKI